MQKEIAKMEAETIDLTDPLEQLLRQTGWTPEYLQERLVKLSEESTKKANTNTKDVNNMTLSDLLGNYQCANLSTGQKSEPTETIELSDDEVSDDVDKVINKDDNEIQEVTEVRVIEIIDDDDDYDSEHKDDDDDEFLEGSTADIIDKEIYGHPPVLEQQIGNFISNKHVSNTLLSTDSIKFKDNVVHLSSDSESENPDKIYDLQDKNTQSAIEKNKKEPRVEDGVSTLPLLKSTAIENSDVNLSPEKGKISINEDEKRKTNKNENLKEIILDCKETQNKGIYSNETHKLSEKTLLSENCLQTVSNLSSCDKSLSSESNDELDESRYNVSENDACHNSVLGFSGVQDGINLIDSFIESPIQFDNAVENITNLPCLKKDINNGIERTDSIYKGEIVTNLADNITDKLKDTQKINVNTHTSKDIYCNNSHKISEKVFPSEDSMQSVSNLLSCDSKLLTSESCINAELDESCYNVSENDVCHSSDLGFSGVQGGINLIDSFIKSTIKVNNAVEDITNLPCLKKDINLNNAIERTDYIYKDKVVTNLADNITDKLKDTKKININSNTKMENIEDAGKLSSDQNKDLIALSSTTKVAELKEIETMVPGIADKPVKFFEIVNRNPLSIESQGDLQAVKTFESTKSIRKSIEEIMEQLDMDEKITKKNFNKVEMNLKTNGKDNTVKTSNLYNLPSSKESEQKHFLNDNPGSSLDIHDASVLIPETHIFSDTLKIHSSSLLLKNQDETIKTSDNNNDLSPEDCAEENAALQRKNHSDSLPDVIDVHSDHQPQNKNIKIHVFPLTEGPIDIIQKDHDFHIDLENDKRTAVEAAELKKDKSKIIFSDTLGSTINNCSVQNSKHAFQCVNAKSGSESNSIIMNPIRDDILEIDMKNKDVSLDENPVTYTKKYDKIIDCEMKKKLFQSISNDSTNFPNDNFNLQVKSSVDDVINEASICGSSSIISKIQMSKNNTTDNIDNINPQVKSAVDVISEASICGGNSILGRIQMCKNNTTDSIENTKGDILNEKVANDNINIDNNNLSRIEIVNGDSTSEDNSIDIASILINITEKDNITKLPMSDNCMFIQQTTLEGSLKSLDKNNQNSLCDESQKSCIDSVNAESEKQIPEICTASPRKSMQDVNDNLDEIRGTNEKPNYNTKEIANDSDEDNMEEENSQERFEEIRKNLKLQLTSLRNKKRMDILQDVKTKVVNIEFPKNSVLPDHIAEDLNSIQPFEDLNKFVSSESDKKLNASLQLIKQDSIPPIIHLTETPILETVVEKQDDEDVHNVFNEIRKIISKQRTTPKTYILKSVQNSHGAVIKNMDGDEQKDSKNEDRQSNIVYTAASSPKLENNTVLQNLRSSNLDDKNTTLSNVVNSPFVSNSLDEFLTDSKLNVSYTIPKSGAEEGLRQNYSDEPIMPPLIAEVKEESNEKPTQEVKFKPKTLAEKRRLLERNKLKEKKRLEKLKKLEDVQKRSYVLFKDKKIFLKSKSMGKCVASIESTIPVSGKKSSEHITPKKPSLLTELYKKARTPVKYRPGPLCKKHLLQTDYSNWASELKALPKIILKVMPQTGKPIHPNLLHILPHWDGEVTDDQIEFALSALVTKGNQNQNRIFKFDVSYENQQTQILARKKIVDKPVKLKHLAAKKEHFSTSEKDVAGVIESLLNYIEIKEIASTLIKYDEDVITSADSPVEAEVPPLDNNVLLKRKYRHTRTDRELMRLNCKVVSVEVEENEPERKCSKPYCRLGCVCKSLQCEKIIGLHCQKVKCIFGCTCPKEKDKIISIAEPTIKLPAGTDLLSTDTVTRIEGEAKRHLARVEKEFTQTVIYTNDKTIVVGFGSKPRRATKTPKKYSDFFDDDILTEESKEPKKARSIPIRPCSVDLEKWNFSDILPYCLVHHLYKCHCRGLSILTPNIPVASFKKEEIDEPLYLKRVEKLSFATKNNADISLNRGEPKGQYSKRTVEDSFKAIIRKSAGLDENLNPENGLEETLYSVTGRPLRKKKKIYEADFVFDVDAASTSHKLTETEKESVDKTRIPSVGEPPQCSRTREIPSKYYRKIRTFTNAVLDNDFVNNLTDKDLFKAQIHENDGDISDSDNLKKVIIEARRKLLEETETQIQVHKKNKRKQKIHVRSDEDIIINTTGKVVPITKRVRKNRVKSVFKGEIIVNDSEWLRKLGQNAKQPLEGYARILPWAALLNGFLSKSLNVYCISDMPLRLLLNVGSKLFGGRIMDVEVFGHKILETPIRAKASWLVSQSENVRDIIKWLLSGTLPSRYKSTCLSFLLVETLPDQFEVRGLCTQGEDKQDTKKNEADLPEEEELSDQITEVKHKNMNNEIDSLFITKGKFRLRELVEDGFDDDLTDNLYMWVGLPEVYKVAKWRVVFLNNDFAFLYFKNIKYSIKYTDLVKLTDMAKEEKLTLILRNVQIRRGYEHSSFGLYVSHTYTDRIFIGPYFINYDEDDIETLRYINQSLVSTESFNRMTGNPNYRCGHWMYERTYYHTPTIYMKDTIDLTNDDTSSKPNKSSIKEDQLQAKSNTTISVPSSVKPIPSKSAPKPVVISAKDEHIIYHNRMPIHIKNSRPRSPSEFNRFIITNIPHFGYLGAYQPDNCSTLEVSWPFEKKVLQFENADNARDFLQERFNQLLQPVPETFKIQVIVLINLDLNEHRPINSDFLSGHCICGYFGTYNFREVSAEFCQQKLNISKEEITKLFAKRAHAYIRQKIEELAEIVGINQNDNENFNVPTILVRAKEEIKLQENIRRQQVKEIQANETKAVAQMKKIYKLVKVLPVKERNIESKIINEILQIRPKRLGANEIVEIKDDDNDADDTSPSPKIQSDTIIYSIESDDTNSTEPAKKRLKRKRVSKRKPRNPKVAKVPYIGPSTSVSILKPRFDTGSKPSPADQNNVTKINKQNIILVKPRQIGMNPTLKNNEDISEVAECQSEETENLVNHDGVGHYIIEYEASDPDDANVTEIFISQPDTAENIDLSMATIIASVPPSSNTTDEEDPVTVSIVSPSIHSFEPFSNASLIKTYSRKVEPMTITSVRTEINPSDLETNTISSSGDLTNKIKVGLQKIMNKPSETVTKMIIQNNKVISTKLLEKESGT